MMRIRFALVVAALTVSVARMQAQTPLQQVTPQVPTVPNRAVTVSSGSAAAMDEDATAKAILQTLLQLKAANDEILKRQIAALSQLDEVAKAADQLKVYTSRN
jgi:hypothetical protein